MDLFIDNLYTNKLVNEDYNEPPLSVTKVLLSL